MEKIKSIIISLVVLGVVYGAINFVVWGAQELYWSKDTQEIKKIESYLESEKANLSLLESKIDTQSSSLDAKQNELDRLEKLGFATSYNSAVDNYNLLLTNYKSNVDTYKSKLTEYNNNVERINELSKESGSRWYVIPVPTGGKSKSIH